MAVLFSRLIAVDSLGSVEKGKSTDESDHDNAAADEQDNKAGGASKWLLLSLLGLVILWAGRTRRVRGGRGSLWGC